MCEEQHCEHDQRPPVDHDEAWRARCHSRRACFIRGHVVIDVANHAVIYERNEDVVVTARISTCLQIFTRHSANMLPMA